MRVSEVTMEPENEQREQLQREVEGLREILGVAQAAVSTLELEPVLEIILKSAMDIVSVPAGSVALYEEESSQVSLAVHVGLSEALVEKSRWLVKPGGLTHRILEEGELFVVQDTQDAPFFNNPLALQEGIRSLIAVPLKVQEKIVGILYLDDFIPRAFHPERLNLLRILGSFAAMCIDNARLHQRTRQMACTDGLTGLFNRRHFKELFHREMSRAERFQTPLSLMMVDVDNFKRFNDLYGHAVGDKVLVTVAELMRHCLREVDMICRYGGEEFLVILPETDQDEAVVAAERVRRMVAEEGIRGLGAEVETGITVSIGVASFPRDGKKMEFLLKVVDDLLYGAKRLGKNKVYFVRKS